MFIGYITIEGVPHVNGKSATWDDEMSEFCLLDGAFSRWRCPECKSCLSEPDDEPGKFICLNMCGLSAASAKRFMGLMAEAQARIRRRERLIEEGDGVSALGTLVSEDEDHAG